MGLKKIDRAHSVPAEHVLFGIVCGRKKDDGHLIGLGVVTGMMGDLVAIHLGHLHVEQHHGKVASKQEPQGLVARLRRDELALEPFEDRRERHQIGVDVVDHQHGRPEGRWNPMR